MIPQKISLKNFLSYGPQVQEVDFSRHQFICLSGKNGHGKSALLDAITWVLWGSARKMSGIARAEEHLVHLGQDHMIVSFDFISGEETYRVTREYTKLRGKKTLSELQLGILNKETNLFVAKTGKTTRETQEIINKTIGLSFEGCINSIFLRQGQSHEFSKKSPQERKEVLSSILGLSHFEEYRTKTLAIIRDLTRDQATGEEEIQKLQKQIQELSNLQQTLETAQYAQQTTITNIKAIKSTLQQAQVEQQTYATEQNHYHLIQQEYSLLKSSYQEKKEQISGYIKQWQSIRKQLRANKASYNKPDISREEITKQLQDIRTLKNQLLDIQKAHLEVRQNIQARDQEGILEQAQTASIFDQKEREILAQIHVLKQKKTALDEQGQTLIASLWSYKTRIASLEPINKEDLATHETFITAKLNHAQSSLRESHRELGQIKEQIQRIEQIQVSLEKSLAQCPTCSQPITDTQKKEIKTQYRTEKELFSYRLSRQTQRNNIATAIITKYKQKIEELEVIRAKQQVYLTAINEQNQLNTQLTIIDTERAKITDEIHAQEKNLQKNSVEKTEKIASLQDKFKALQDYRTLKTKEEELLKQELEIKKILAQTNEETLQKTLQDLENWHLQKTSIESTLREKEHLCQLITEQMAHVRAAKKRVNSLQENLLRMSLSITSKDQTDKIALLNKQLEDTTQIYAEYTSQIAVLKNQLSTLEKIRQKLQECYAKKQAISVNLDDYQILSTALGKNGIQALIIEHALPELEQEANAILSRLSENNTQVIFESIKDLKNGNSRETLDIHISDNMGIRPYELFSGGEAFRIDFALRIALSKLLAKRSGTPLQTLIIDEGFGSQDDAGLEKILEALHRIQSDFEKVIVVSHLPQMKNQFPANFIIEKTAAGSQVTIAEQW